MPSFDINFRLEITYEIDTNTEHEAIEEAKKRFKKWLDSQKCPMEESDFEIRSKKYK